MSFHRHLGSITALCSSEHLVFTGSEDHTIRAWDIRMKMALHAVGTGSGIPIALYYGDDQRLYIITQEKTLTTACGGRLSEIESSSHIGDPSPNLYFSLDYVYV